MRQMREGNLRLNHFLASIWFVGCEVSAARMQTSEKQCALESVAARDQTTRPESRHFNLAHFESIKLSHRQCHQSGRLHGRRPGLLNEPSSIPAVKNTTFLTGSNRTLLNGRYIACRSHFKMSGCQPDRNVVFSGVRDLFLMGFQITQCRRFGPDRAGRLRLPRWPSQTAGEVCGVILCLSVFGEINDHLLNVGLRECTLLFGADGLL